MNLTDPGYEKKQAYNITLYDLQGGPLPSRAIAQLEAEIERLAKEFNLAYAVHHE